MTLHGVSPPGLEKETGAIRTVVESLHRRVQEARNTDSAAWLTSVATKLADAQHELERGPRRLAADL